MSGLKTQTLGKKERLKSRKQIDALFNGGSKLSVFPFRMIYREVPTEVTLQAGFTVGSKNFPRAVDRNRIKRLTREAYRLQKMALEKLLKDNNRQLQLFFIYTGREVPIALQVQKSIGSLLEKLIALR